MRHWGLSWGSSACALLPFLPFLHAPSPVVCVPPRSNTAEENEKADGEEKTTEKTSQESKTEPTTPARTIVGLWAGATDNEFYYLFNDDKTGSFALGGEIKDFTYTDNGDSVTIIFNNNTKEHVFKYSIDGDVLSIENDFGAVEKYNLQ